MDRYKMSTTAYPMKYSQGEWVRYTMAKAVMDDLHATNTDLNILVNQQINIIAELNAVKDKELK